MRTTAYHNEVGEGMFNPFFLYVMYIVGDITSHHNSLNNSRPSTRRRVDCLLNFDKINHRILRVFAKWFYERMFRNGIFVYLSLITFLFYQKI